MRTAESVWQEYQRGVDYNNRIDLYDRVKTNENFFVGRQWEGLNVGEFSPPSLFILPPSPRRSPHLRPSLLPCFLPCDDPPHSVRFYVHRGSLHFRGCCLQSTSSQMYAPLCNPWAGNPRAMAVRE